MNPVVPPIELRYYNPSITPTQEEIEAEVAEMAKSDREILLSNGKIKTFRNKQNNLRNHLPVCRAERRRKLIAKEEADHIRRLRAIPALCDRYLKSLKKTANKKSNAISCRIGLHQTIIARRTKKLRKIAAAKITRQKKAAAKVAEQVARREAREAARAAAREAKAEKLRKKKEEREMWME